VGPAALNGGDAGVANIWRRVEIGFADFQVDDVASLRLKRSRADEDFEGRFATEPAHT
jgi:hypothetical protein